MEDSAYQRLQIVQTPPFRRVTNGVLSLEEQDWNGGSSPRGWLFHLHLQNEQLVNTTDILDLCPH